VVSIAQNWFSFLRDSKAHTQIVLGDARITLERELASAHAEQFDLIAVDAFSSDAIPVHLLTAESAEIYRRRLRPGGLLLLHISNRALDLEPVARGMARYLGWQAVQFVSGDDPATGESSSKWVLITADTEFLERTGMARQLSGWNNRPPIVWTDDFASLWHVLRF
jgi:spermidine synthase